MKTNTPHTPAPASPAHTPGPWHFDGNEFCGSLPIYGNPTRTHWIASIVLPDDAAHENGKRIVACVNACEGLSDPVAQIKELRDALFNLAWCIENRNANGEEIAVGALLDAQKALANFSKGGAK